MPFTSSFFCFIPIQMNHKLMGNFSRNARHNNANMIIQKALSSADYAAIAEPKSLFNIDSKRPDGMTTFPYKEGKPLAWDFTCVDTVADSYFHKSSLEAGKTADMAEKKKIHKSTLGQWLSFHSNWNRDLRDFWSRSNQVP